ncbi:hypothetical protein C8N40_11196 [Pontibacter mucosus]|uniref:Uncharacterized protein n=1 Tax=Pontibacter mucosus TaxID=1649266 RepID=A0A2T5YD34_9BACT|nr:hypothetical protein [Pontibacter mucosus]PTX14431.1 hypothetical protein C8N40_11196 [Pontibacter mucosus]
MSNFNPNTLKPGDAVRTDRGQATYLEYRQGMFRNRCHRVQLQSGETRWYTTLQLQQYNREEATV